MTTMQGDEFVTEFGLSLRPDKKLAGATLLGVRPEKIQISAQLDQPNAMEGIVELVSYLGPSTEYRVRIAADRHVLIQQPNREAKALFRHCLNIVAEIDVSVALEHGTATSRRRIQILCMIFCGVVLAILCSYKY